MEKELEKIILDFKTKWENKGILEWEKLDKKLKELFLKWC